MGAVGPTQFVVFVNGRLRTFNKSTGIADGVLNADPDVFFSSVMTPVSPPIVANFTSDPQVRYDRLSGRWFLTIIDVCCTNSSCSSTAANRVLLAVCDAASAGTITGSTVWTFFFFQGDASDFLDYPSLGVDANALYIGGDMFTSAGSFKGTNGYVMRKSSVLGTGPLVVTTFAGLVPSANGVDNYDLASTEGYFIGVDNATFGTLMLRRVSNPGGTPTISSNISITVNATSFPATVDHLGNTRGNNGELDALNDRLFAAHLRNGRLWTAHNIQTNNTGTTSGSTTRDASRWYELQNLSGTPSVVQSGTLYDNSTPNNSNQRNYWIPTIMVSGQGHTALGCSIAGSGERINAFVTGRLSGDALGTMRDGPGGSSLSGYTSSSTAYNPPGDPGGNFGRRWGDYSFVSLDPTDDMTMWCIQEYCNGTNTYGVRAVQLIAPPPATPSAASPPSVAGEQSSVSVTITGTQVSGSGFFDPGSGFSKRIGASVSGGVTVNSVTYVNPTTVTLNLSTVGASLGPQNVTIVNPDSQSRTGTGILAIDAPLPIQLASFTGSVVNGINVLLRWTTLSEINNYGFEVQRSIRQLSDYATIPNSFIPGHGTTTEPHSYSYTDVTAAYGRWWYRLKQIDLDGTIHYIDGIRVDVLTTVAESGLPLCTALHQNYPNPFNPSTTIRYSLAKQTLVRLRIYNTLGQEVATLVDGAENAGEHSVEWAPRTASSGVYLCRLQAGDYVENRRLVLLK
jgi:hypothetical protein